MRYTTRVLIISIIGGLGVGCSAHDGIDSGDAARGWRSTQTAMSGAGVSAAPAPGSVSGTGSVGPDGVTGIATGTFDCPDGGSLAIRGEGDVTSSDVSGAVSLEFDGCTADGVTIDGTLDYQGTVDANHVAATISGELTWSGAVQGDCAIDVSAEVTANGVSSSAELHGDVCGHAWADLKG